MIGTFNLPISTSSGLTGFITEWNLTANDTTGKTITLPLVNGYNYDAVVYWGDGTSSVVKRYNDTGATHLYSTTGTTQINIVGTCEGWSFNNGGDKLKITKIINFGGPHFNGFKYLHTGFYGCTNLTTLGSNPIKASGAGCSSFQQIFDGCNNSNFKSVPVNLFRYNTEVTNFGYAFRSCAYLSAVTADLFQYNTKATSFLTAFDGCTRLSNLPTDLFRYNVNVTNFLGLFQNCVSLSGVPSGIFQYNTGVTRVDYLFNGCTALSGVPTDIFRYNTAVTTFQQVFDNCTNLATVPVDLFRYNTACTNFSYAFRNNNKLQQNATIFAPTGVTNRFTNQSVDFQYCFQRSSFTGTQGVAPDLWNQNFGTGTPTKTGCWNGAGNSVASLSNYASIPADWK